MSCTQAADIEWVIVADKPGPAINPEGRPVLEAGCLGYSGDSGDDRVRRGKDKDKDATTVASDKDDDDHGANVVGDWSTGNNTGTEQRQCNPLPPLPCTSDGDCAGSTSCMWDSGVVVPGTPGKCKLKALDNFVSCCSVASGIPISIYDQNRILASGREKCVPKEVTEVEVVTATFGRIQKQSQILADYEWDGYYTLYMQWPQGAVITGESTFLNKHGYLSADRRPLQQFYGAMGLIYMLMGIFWGLMMACRHKDLLQLQYWVGIVLVLCMLEMAFSWGDLFVWNDGGSDGGQGARSQGLLIFAKLLSAVKNTLSRLLVLVTAMGLSVVKPRLGDVKKQIAAVGVASLAMFGIYGVVHEITPAAAEKTNTEMLVIIPVSVLDALIFWWIFFSLHHTMKVLSLRQNVVKLTLYKRFQFILAVAVIATIAFTGWDLTIKSAIPSTDPAAAEQEWRNEWFREWGFWHLLFCGILTGIMFLFRPTMNNSRYAYAALETDLLEGEDEEEVYSAPNVPHFGAETMTTRTANSKKGKATKQVQPKSDIEEELLWVEENIPTSVTANDNNFMNFPMDSDEELANTRFEASKME